MSYLRKGLRRLDSCTADNVKNVTILVTLVFMFLQNRLLHEYQRVMTRSHEVAYACSTYIKNCGQLLDKEIP